MMAKCGVLQQTQGLHLYTEGDKGGSGREGWRENMVGMDDEVKEGKKGEGREG